jgi:hypothetical protein
MVAAAASAAFAAEALRFAESSNALCRQGLTDFLLFQ